MTDRKLSLVLDWARRNAASGDDAVADRELLDRFVAHGDEAAFELLVWRHQRLVYGVCRRVLNNGHDAEDAFQAVFLVLARKGRTIRQGASVAAWLYRVAFRTALAARAARVNQKRREQPLLAAREVAAPVAMLPASAQHELRAILDEELNRLPECFRTPTVLCYLAGKTVDEAAAQLRCPRGTVASRLARARDRLRARLTVRGVALPVGLTAVVLSEATVVSAAPDALVRAAVHVTKLYSVGSTAAGMSTSARIATLAERVIHAMFLRKLVFGVAGVTAFAAAFFAGGVLALQAFAQVPEAPGIGPKENAPAEAKVDAAPPSKPAPAQSVVYFAGHLEASEEVQVHARVGGHIEKIHVKEGIDVKQGAPLFDIDATIALLNLDRTAAELHQADERAEYTAKQLERTKSLLANGATSREEYELARRNAAAARTSAQAAQVAVARAKREVNAGRVIAPIAGHVARLPVTVGSVIPADGSTILATIVNVDPIAVHFEMDEKTFVRYQRLKHTGKGQPITIHFAIPAADESGFPHEAKLESVGSRVDPATGTIAIRARAANPERLLIPGMFVRVRVTFPSPKAS